MVSRWMISTFSSSSARPVIALTRRWGNAQPEPMLTRMFDSMTRTASSAEISFWR